ncbi:MAG: hypothetical protein Q4C02_09260 [Eubacteriales bacterium]|nr:hypothetical protein [Sarcina sp.]MDO4418448.1 hypothetical protein [Eubacteriales bacterium]
MGKRRGRRFPAGFAGPESPAAGDPCGASETNGSSFENRVEKPVLFQITVIFSDKEHISKETIS